MIRSAPLLTLFLSASVAFAQNANPTATEVLNRYIEAVGGETAWKEVKTLQAEGRMNLAGLSGKFESWSKFPGKSRANLDLGILKISTGSDGENYWIIDQNGKVNRLGPTEAKLQKLSDYFSDPAKLIEEKDKIKADLVREEADTAGGPGWYVLKLLPEGLDSLFIFINKKTFLLERAFLPVLPSPVTTWFSDYRPVGKVQFPFKQKQKMGSIQEQTVEIASARLNAELADTLFAVPGEHQSRKDFSFPAGTAKTIVAFELVANHIHLKVTLNDSIPGDFILDSGAGATVLSSEFASRCKLPTEGKLGAQGVGGEQEANLTKVAKLEVGGLTLTDQVVATISFEKFTPLIGRTVDGILGYDFISRFVLEVNYTGKTVTMYDPPSFGYDGTGEKLALELVDNNPTVEATLDGEFKGRFRLDTGSAQGIDLNAPFVKANGLLKRYPKKISEMMGAGVGGRASYQLARAESFALGSAVIKKPVVGLWENTQGAFASDRVQGNIGYRILKRFKLIFNYPKNEMILERAENFDEPEKFDRAGLVLTKEEGKTMVAHVLPGSPAEKAGFKVEDEILAVNGKPAAEFSLDQLRELFAGKPGTKVKLKFSREGKGKEVKLELKELL